MKPTVFIPHMQERYTCSWAPPTGKLTLYLRMGRFMWAPCPQPTLLAYFHSMVMLEWCSGGCYSLFLSIALSIVLITLYCWQWCCWHVEGWLGYLCLTFCCTKMCPGLTGLHWEQVRVEKLPWTDHLISLFIFFPVFLVRELKIMLYKLLWKFRHRGCYTKALAHLNEIAYMVMGVEIEV